MARPANADSAETIARIIAAALDELAQQDEPTAPALRAVAKRAGVGLGTIQYYFESKETLLEACLDGYHERLAALAGSLTSSLKQGDSPSTTAIDLVDAAVAALFAFARKERGLLRFRAAATFSRGELAPLRQRDFMGGLSQLAADALAAHVNVPLLDARLAVHAMSATIVRFALMSDAEVGWATGLSGEAAHAAMSAYVPRAARRLLRLPEQSEDGLEIKR